MHSGGKSGKEFLHAEYEVVADEPAMGVAHLSWRAPDMHDAKISGLVDLALDWVC